MLSTAYTTGGVAGNTLYVNISTEATCKEFRVGHQVLLRNSANYLDDTNAKVTAVVLNGTSSLMHGYYSFQSIQCLDQCG